MSEAFSCGGVVIFRGKILVLYRNYMNTHDGWVLPKGTVEKGETHEQTAIREILEESGASVKVREYIGETQYAFKAGSRHIDKSVYWYLCEADSYDCKPQREEYFMMLGFISIMKHIIFLSLIMKSRYYQRLIQYTGN